MFRILASIGIGLFLGGIGCMLIGVGDAGVWTLPVGSGLAIIGIVGAKLTSTIGGSSEPDSYVVQAARDAGRYAVARVDVLRQTGGRVNDQPVCDLELTIQPSTGAAYRLTVRRLITFVEIPRYQQGKLLLAVVLVDGEPDVALLPEEPLSAHWSGPKPPPVTAAGPLLPRRSGAVRADGRRSRPLLGTDRSRRPLRIALYLLVGVAAFAVALLPHRVAVAQMFEALPQGRVSLDVRQPGPLKESLRVLTEDLGHDQVSSVGVFEDYLTADAPVRAGERKTDVWVVRKGKATRQRPATIQPESAAANFSIDEVDWAAIAPALERIRAENGFSETDQATVRATRWNSPIEESNDIVVTLSVRDDYRAVFYRMAADGSGLTKFSES